MPKKQLPTKSDFLEAFEDIFRRFGAKHIGADSVMQIFVKPILQKLLTSKRNKKIGVEDCIVYEKGDRMILGWSGYVRSIGGARDEDLGWVVMIDKRFPQIPCFFSFPMRRTGEGFLIRFKKWFKGFWEIVNHWHPSCPICHADPKIELVRGSEMHAVAYKCPNGHVIPNTSVYRGISDESRIFMSKSFENYSKYRKREQEKGIFRTPSRFIRAGISNLRAQDDGVNYDDGPHLE